jgi:hypothetical protein
MEPGSRNDEDLHPSGRDTDGELSPDTDLGGGLEELFHDSVWDRAVVIPIPRIAPLGQNRPDRSRRPVSAVEAVTTLRSRVRRLQALVLWTLAALIVAGATIAVMTTPSNSLRYARPDMAPPGQLSPVDDLDDLVVLAQQCRAAAKAAREGTGNDGTSSVGALIDERERTCSRLAKAAADAANADTPD